MQQGNIIEQAKELLKEHVGIEPNQRVGLDIDMLCHKLFKNNDDGKKLINWLVESYILTSTPAIEGNLVVKYNTNYSMYKDGYCDAIKHLLERANRYESRLNQEGK